MPTSLKSCTSLNASECFRKFAVVEHAFQLLAWMLRFQLWNWLGLWPTEAPGPLLAQTRNAWRSLPGALLPWSQMQNLAARTDAQQHKFYLKRKEHHACHLMFVAQVYQEQVDNARHAHIEQPWAGIPQPSKTWCWIVLHQCMFGCACLDQDGFWKLLKKPTGILSSKVSMQAALSKQCDGHALFSGRLSTWTWPSRFLPWGLPAWSWSHDCSCHLCPWSCSTMGLWTCSLRAEGGHWMSFQAPNDPEEWSSSLSATLASKPWTSKARSPGGTSRGASD